MKLKVRLVEHILIFSLKNDHSYLNSQIYKIAIRMFFIVNVLVGDVPGYHEEEEGNIAEEEESRDQEHSDGNMTGCVRESWRCLRGVSKRSPQILYLYHHADEDGQGYSHEVEQRDCTSVDEGTETVFRAVRVAGIVVIMAQDCSHSYNSRDIKTKYQV